MSKLNISANTFLSPGKFSTRVLSSGRRNPHENQFSRMERRLREMHLRAKATAVAPYTNKVVVQDPGDKMLLVQVNFH